MSISRAAQSHDAFQDHQRKYANGRDANSRMAARRASAMAGRAVLKKDVSMDEFQKMASAKELSPGSTWDWFTGNIYAPKGQGGAQ